jgi:uncharacterized phage-associated protein
MIHFNIDKTIEAAAYLIKRRPNRRENYMRLLKLLYLAERQSLKERGSPICGDAPYAMAQGPVPSRTLDLVKGKDSSSEKWEQFIETAGYEVELKCDPGNLNLCRAEINILDKVAERFQSYDEWDLVRWCHKNIPEYKKNWAARGKKARSRIPFEDVLREIGRLDDQPRILAEINADIEFSRLFSDHMPTRRKQEA